jgi:hypothetical protein
MRRMRNVFGVLIVTVLAFAAARPAPVGGGAVLEANRRLLSALDAGDEAALARSLDVQRSGLTWTSDGTSEGKWGEARDFDLSLTDESGRAFATQSAERGAATLRQWAGEKATTRILRAWSDCGAEKIGFCSYDLERKRGDDVRRYRATALARIDPEMKAWRVWLLHISPLP